MLKHLSTILKQCGSSSNPEFFFKYKLQEQELFMLNVYNARGSSRAAPTHGPRAHVAALAASPFSRARVPPPRAQGFIRAALAATEQVQDFFKGDESAQAVAALKKEVHVDIDNAVAKFAKIDFLLIQSVNVKNIATAVIRHQYEHLKATIERGLISIKDGHDYAAVIARDMKMLDRSQDDEVAELVQRKLGASDVMRRLQELKLGVEGRAFRKWRKNALEGVSTHYFK